MRKLRRKHDSRVNKKFYFWSTITIIVLLIILGYAKAQSPQVQAKKEAYLVAKKYGNVRKAEDFYVFNRKQTYYTIYGTNKRGQEVYVITSQNGKKVNINAQDKGISVNKAKNIVKVERNPKKITKTSLGLVNNKPVWEVTYLNNQNNICYDLISFKTGKIIKSIQNI